MISSYIHLTGDKQSIVTGTCQLELKEQTMKNIFARFANDESGATAIEYGLIAGLIGVVIISAVTAVGTSISAKFNEVSSKLG